MVFEPRVQSLLPYSHPEAVKPRRSLPWYPAPNFQEWPDLELATLASRAKRQEIDLTSPCNSPPLLVLLILTGVAFGRHNVTSLISLFWRFATPVQRVLLCGNTGFSNTSPRWWMGTDVPGCLLTYNLVRKLHFTVSEKQAHTLFCKIKITGKDKCKELNLPWASMPTLRKVFLYSYWYTVLPLIGNNAGRQQEI